MSKVGLIRCFHSESVVPDYKVWVAILPVFIFSEERKHEHLEYIYPPTLTEHFTGCFYE